MLVLRVQPPPSSYSTSPPFAPTFLPCCPHFPPTALNPHLLDLSCSSILSPFSFFPDIFFASRQTFPSLRLPALRNLVAAYPCRPQSVPCEPCKPPQSSRKTRKLSCISTTAHSSHLPPLAHDPSSQFSSCPYLSPVAPQLHASPLTRPKATLAVACEPCDSSPFSLRPRACFVVLNASFPICRAPSPRSCLSDGHHASGCLHETTTS